MIAIVLLCALSIAPQDCQMTTARHFERVEAVYRMPFECLRDAQMWAAENVAARPGEYVKISCIRSSFNANG